MAVVFGDVRDVANTGSIGEVWVRSPEFRPGHMAEVLVTDQWHRCELRNGLFETPNLQEGQAEFWFKGDDFSEISLIDVPATGRVNFALQLELRVDYPPPVIQRAQAAMLAAEKARDAAKAAEAAAKAAEAEAKRVAGSIDGRYENVGGTYARRNSDGRLQVTAPTVDRDAANKQYVDGLNTSTRTYIDSKTAGISGSVEATGGMYVKRDAAGRTQVAKPASDSDAANKKYVDTQISSTETKISTVQTEFAAFKTLKREERRGNGTGAGPGVLCMRTGNVVTLRIFGLNYGNRNDVGAGYITPDYRPTEMVPAVISDYGAEGYSACIEFHTDGSIKGVDWLKPDKVYNGTVSYAV